MSNEAVSGKRVLIVEDEPDFAALLESILTDAGYTVTTAHTCEDALVQARKTRPDVITLDIQMPRKSGAFFFRKLKAQKNFRYTPVVVVTGLTRDKEMEKLIQTFLEADDVPRPQVYLEKPIDGPRLLKAVEEAMATAIP